MKSHLSFYAFTVTVIFMLCSCVSSVSLQYIPSSSKDIKKLVNTIKYTIGSCDDNDNAPCYTAYLRYNCDVSERIYYDTSSNEIYFELRCPDNMQELEMVSWEISDSYIIPRDPSWYVIDGNLAYCTIPVDNVQADSIEDFKQWVLQFDTMDNAMHSAVDNNSYLDGSWLSPCPLVINIK